MPQWLSDILEKSSFFMPHGHCYLWIPSLLWMHVLSDTLIGLAYLSISFLLYLLVRKIRLPFSPVFIAFGLFIGLCGLTHFMSVWTVWNPDYFLDGIVKAATAAASVATAIGLLYIRPQIEEVVHTARLSEERRVQLESKNAELEILYRKIMELDEAKTQFFANVSHELRTPLTLIIGPTERMLAQENLTEGQRKQLQTVTRNSKLLLKQVNDLLDVAKLEAGRMTLNYSRIDLASWLRRVVSYFETAASINRIEFDVAAPANLIAEVDPELLERVLVNLISNAFKFTPAGGRVSVELSREAPELRLSVSDTGPGIDAKEQHSIFERFRQGDGGATRKHGGTGLGLAIAKEFTELHGGRIELTSSPGHGSRFDVLLPLSAPASVTVREAPTESDTARASSARLAVQELVVERASNEPCSFEHSSERPSVLVVEDNADVRQFVASTLSSSHNVLTADDGEDGLHRAIAMRPDLVVTDIMMPRMSGDQLVTELRSRREFDDVPILLLSAKADDQQRIALLSSGAQDYLTKPFLPQELLARASNLISLKRVGDALRSALNSASRDVQTLARDLATKHSQLRIALEAVSVARDHAEHASQIKTQFLAMISHELRTPLSNMHMNVRLLEKRLPNAEEQAILMRLRRAATQMSALIEGLLDHARLESGKLKGQAEPIDVYELAREVVSAHAENLVPEVELTLADKPLSPPILLSDAKLVRVILDNLLSNALKFTKQGRITVTVAGSNTSTTIEVHDTGIGIAAPDLLRIFEPFEQLEPVKRKSIPGVGLGLSLVKQIVETLHGRIDVESIPDQGSVFRVYLPSMQNDQ